MARPLAIPVRTWLLTTRTSRPAVALPSRLNVARPRWYSQENPEEIKTAAASEAVVEGKAAGVKVDTPLDATEKPSQEAKPGAPSSSTHTETIPSESISQSTVEKEAIETIFADLFNDNRPSLKEASLLWSDRADSTSGPFSGVNAPRSKVIPRTIPHRKDRARIVERAEADLASKNLEADRLKDFEERKRQKERSYALDDKNDELVQRWRETRELPREERRAKREKLKSGELEIFNDILSEMFQMPKKGEQGTQEVEEELSGPSAPRRNRVLDPFRERERQPSTRSFDSGPSSVDQSLNLEGQIMDTLRPSSNITSEFDHVPRPTSRPSDAKSAADHEFDTLKEEIAQLETDADVLAWAETRVFGRVTSGDSAEEDPAFMEAYPLILSHLIAIFRDRFNDPHAALALFEHAKGLSPESYLTGCSTGAYNEMIETRWKAFKDLEGVHRAVMEMKVNGVGWDRHTMRFIGDLTESLGQRRLASGEPDKADLELERDFGKNFLKQLSALEQRVEQEVDGEARRARQAQWRAQQAEQMDHEKMHGRRDRRIPYADTKALGPGSQDRSRQGRREASFGGLRRMGQTSEENRAAGGRFQGFNPEAKREWKPRPHIPTSFESDGARRERFRESGREPPALHGGSPERAERRGPRKGGFGLS